MSQGIGEGLPEFVGFLLVLIAGMMNGSFALPMKYTVKWNWENTWLVWAAFALFVFPVATAFLTVPQLGIIFAHVRWAVLLAVVGFGAAWGISQIFFGLGVTRVGVAVGFAIVLGLAAAVGTFVPLLAFQTAHLFTLSALGAIGGVAVIITGVALCSRAEIAKSSTAKTATDPGSRLGIVFCVLSGIGGSMINLGLAFGSPILTEAQKQQVSPLSQTGAIWLPLLVAGFLSTAAYCVVLLCRNRTWRRYGQPGAASHWLLAVLMGTLWFGSVELYGIGTRRLGNWGVVVGWPVFMSSAIITANLWGLFTGEWKEASYRARGLMLAGVAAVVASIFVVGLTGGLR